jgi:hypothetical protein
LRGDEGAKERECPDRHQLQQLMHAREHASASCGMTTAEKVKARAPSVRAVKTTNFFMGAHSSRCASQSLCTTDCVAARQFEGWSHTSTKILPKARRTKYVPTAIAPKYFVSRLIDLRRA